MGESSTPEEEEEGLQTEVIKRKSGQCGTEQTKKGREENREEKNPLNFPSR